jgi:hypothetical protein
MTPDKIIEPELKPCPFKDSGEQAAQAIADRATRELREENESLRDQLEKLR